MTKPCESAEFMDLFVVFESKEHKAQADTSLLNWRKQQCNSLQTHQQRVLDATLDPQVKTTGQHIFHSQPNENKFSEKYPHAHGISTRKLTGKYNQNTNQSLPSDAQNAPPQQMSRTSDLQSTFDNLEKNLNSVDNLQGVLELLSMLVRHTYQHNSCCKSKQPDHPYHSFIKTTAQSLCSKCREEQGIAVCQQCSCSLCASCYNTLESIKGSTMLY